MHALRLKKGLATHRNIHLVAWGQVKMEDNSEGPHDLTQSLGKSKVQPIWTAFTVHTAVFRGLEENWRVSRQRVWNKLQANSQILKKTRRVQRTRRPYLARKSQWEES